MNDFYQHYANQLFQHYRLYANFPPRKIAAIGDIGTLEGKLYKRKDNIKNVAGLDFKTRPGDPEQLGVNIKNHMNLSTSNNTEVNLMVKGEAGLVNAGMKVQLKDVNSFYLNLAGVTIDEIEDQVVLGNKILDLYKQGSWNKDWVVVTSTITAQSSLILGSLTGNSVITLESQVDVPGIQLDNAGLKLGIKNKVSVEMDIVDNNSLTPLLEVARVRRKPLPFSKPSFGFSESTVMSDEKLLDIIRLKDKKIGDFFELEKLR